MTSHLLFVLNRKSFHNYIIIIAIHALKHCADMIYILLTLKKISQLLICSLRVIVKMISPRQFYLSIANVFSKKYNSFLYFARTNSFSIYVEYLEKLSLISNKKSLNSVFFVHVILLSYMIVGPLWNTYEITSE